MMFLAVVAMAIPDLFHVTRGDAAARRAHLTMSVGISVVLLVVYALSLVFSLRTHAHLYAAEDEGAEEELPHWSPRKAIAGAARPPPSAWW